MKKYTKTLVVTIVFIFSCLNSQAQGCVAIRQFSGIGNAVGQGNLLTKREWNFSANYRYFKSFRHFRGTEQEYDRLTNNTEVINKQHGLDVRYMNMVELSVILRILKVLAI